MKGKPRIVIRRRKNTSNDIFVAWNYHLFEPPAFMQGGLSEKSRGLSSKI